MPTWDTSICRRRRLGAINTRARAGWELRAGPLIWHLAPNVAMPFVQRQVAPDNGAHHLAQALGGHQPDAHAVIMAGCGQALTIGLKATAVIHSWWPVSTRGVAAKFVRFHSRTV
jgi:hypothetical protein